MDVFSQLTEHVLPIDFAAATIYPEVVGHPYRLGTSKSRYDAQITAFCGVDGEHLATRNEKDVAGAGVALINPWSDA